MIRALVAVVRSIRIVTAEPCKFTNCCMENSKTSLFAEKIRKVYGAKAEGVLQDIQSDKHESFRVSTLLYKPQEIVKTLISAGFDIKPGPLPNSFINFSDDKFISRQTTVPEPAVYLQGLSSMIPVYALNPKPGENILDLCAAPGSKTSLMAINSNLKAKIVAVETNANRFNFLKKNLLAQGITNVETLKINSVVLPKARPQYQNFFDKVLLDAPCSNEAMYRGSNLSLLAGWKLGMAKKLSMLQKRLLASAVSLTKPGGLIVYSTCTYGVEENEAVVDWALKKFPGLKVEKLKFDFALNNVAPGLTQWNHKVFDPTISNSFRILPNKFFDAFYICALSLKK